ncbi:MAG: gephyrin-like molybdotransferase Glp [Candidatus Aminicenantales bacterium]
MISFKEAQNTVLDSTPILDQSEIRVDKIYSGVLAEDIKAKEDIPLFTNSAMDGFALRSRDTVHVPAALKLKGCIKAGDYPAFTVGRGEAAKIMTGAFLPPGADAVVMVEETEEKAGEVIVKKAVKKGENVRFKGEEIKKGQVALNKGTKLNPAAAGFLAALGYEKVWIFSKPRVALLITGNELIKPGEEIKPGKTWESNSVSLQAALADLNISPLSLGTARDSEPDLERGVKKGLSSSDILIISGGVSVGKYDLVQEILLREGVKRIFWRVAIKPGKPLFFGKKEKTLVFGLPGNPVSALVTFLEFVRPAILKMMGQKEFFLKEKEAILEHEFHKKSDRSYLLRGFVQEKKGTLQVKSTGSQQSHMLSSFARANCLIYLDKDKVYFRPGEKVKIHILPWS